MQKWQLRVIIERAELEIKQHDLDDFLVKWEAGEIKQLSSEELDRLKRQAAAMLVYGKVLEERIASFK